MDEYKDRLRDIFFEESMGDFEPDLDSMKLIYETKDYWLVRYDEGQAEFINIVYKDRDREMQTIEV